MKTSVTQGSTRRKLLRCKGFGGGQGRGRTADLPIFSRTLVPTELPGRSAGTRIAAARQRAPTRQPLERPLVGPPQGGRSWRTRVLTGSPRARCSGRAHVPGVGDELGQPSPIDLLEPNHHKRRVVVARSGEEDLGLAEEKGLLLGLVADVQHRDVGSNGRAADRVSARDTTRRSRVRPP